MSVTTSRFLVITLESSISENHKAGVDKVHAGAQYLVQVRGGVCGTMCYAA